MWKWSDTKWTVLLYRLYIQPIDWSQYSALLLKPGDQSWVICTSINPLITPSQLWHKDLKRGGDSKGKIVIWPVLSPLVAVTVAGSLSVTQGQWVCVCVCVCVCPCLRVCVLREVTEAKTEHALEWLRLPGWPHKPKSVAVSQGERWIMPSLKDRPSCQG